MGTSRALASGLLLLGAALFPLLPSTGAAAATAGAVAPDLEYESALSVQWAPSTLPVALPERSLARVAVQYATAAPLRDAELQISTGGAVDLRSAASVRLGTLPADDPSRATVTFEVMASGTGEVEAKLAGYAPGGTFLRYSAVLSFATGAGRVAFSVDGMLAAQVGALGLQRPSLGAARYGRELATLLGSGAEQTFSEPAGPHASAWTGISGTIEYTAVNGTHHPARSIYVQIWDDNGTSPSGTLVTTTTTNMNGQYSASVTTLRSDGKPRDIYVQALAADGGFLVVPASGGTLAQHIDSTAHTATGSRQTVNLVANNTTSNNTAFDVADMLVTGDQYVLRIHDGHAFPRITVSYPNSGGTSFTPGKNTAKILQGDTFDWDVVLHEFGHYVAANLDIDTSQGGLHGWQDNLGQLYGKSAGIQLAWSEGFATWFALTAELVENVAALKIPNAGDDYFDDTDDANFHVPMNTNSPYSSTGEDNELSVARTLWHMRMDTDLAMTDLQIINTLVAKHANTLSVALPALLAAAGAAPFGNVDTGGDQYTASAELKMNTFGCLETSQVVAPRITAPAAGDVVGGSAPPTFTWQADGAGPSNRLDSFSVQFWSPTWGKLLFHSPQTTSEATADSDSYTPTQSDWNTLMATTDESGNYPSAMNVVVVGSDTNTPVTGPYASCAVRLLIAAPGLTVTPADTADGVIAPIPQVCADGYFDPQIDQFVLSASWLQPDTTYSLALYDAGNGYGAVTDLAPDTVTTNDLGDVAATTITIPDLPAENWPLILTPPSGRPATTTVPIVWDVCAETVAALGSTPLYWGGAGVEPGTTVTLSWDGTEIEQVTSQPDGEYWYSGQTPPTVTCTGTDTLTIDAETYSGPVTSSGPFECTGAAPIRDVLRPVGGDAGAGGRDAAIAASGSRCASVVPPARRGRTSPAAVRARPEGA